MKKLEKRLRERGIARYTIYELDKPFLFYLLDLKKTQYKFSLCSLFSVYHNRILGPGYGVVFYDSKGEFVTYVGSGFAKEKNAIECFYELLLNISQLKGGEHNG